MDPNPFHIGREIIHRINEPWTRVALALYLASGAYLVFHVAFLDVVTPLTIAAFMLWMLL